MTNKLYAAQYFGDPDYQWFAIPQVLNFFHCPLSNYRDVRVVEQNPQVFYLMLRAWAKDRPKVLQSGRHFWHSLSYNQRHHPLTRELGQRMLRAFHAGEGDVGSLVDKAALHTQFYCEGETVKSIKRGSFSYNDNDNAGELEYWTTLECSHCGQWEYIREQLGNQTPAGFLACYQGDLERFEPVTGPYCRCKQCDRLTRVKAYPAEELPVQAYDYAQEDAREAWDDYTDVLGEFLDMMVEHLEKHGLPKPTGLRLDVQHANWMGSDAWAECAVDGKELANKMRVNSDFMISHGSLNCFPNGNAELFCRLSHHDVPQGSPITITPQWECELEPETEYLNFEEARESLEGLADIAETLLCGAPQEFEFSPGSTFKTVHRTNLAYKLSELAKACGLDDLDQLTGYNLALGLLLRQLITDVRDKQRVRFSHIEQIRAVLNHWLAHSTEEAPQ